MERVLLMIRSHRVQHGRQQASRPSRLACACCLALTVLLTGCGLRAARSVDPKPAPVFEMQITQSRPCPSGSDPQRTCFSVAIHNLGEKAGDGTCVVRHYIRGGEGVVGEGPSFSVSDVQPDKTIRAQGQAHLTAPFTTLRFTSYCTPGPRL
jgi:hypothetical protein